MSGHQLTHIVFFVLEALLEMMRETKNVYPVRLNCAISSSCFSLHCVLGY